MAFDWSNFSDEQIDNLEKSNAGLADSIRRAKYGTDLDKQRAVNRLASGADLKTPIEQSPIDYSLLLPNRLDQQPSMRAAEPIPQSSTNTSLTQPTVVESKEPKKEIIPDVPKIKEASKPAAIVTTSRQVNPILEQSQQLKEISPPPSIKQPTSVYGEELEDEALKAAMQQRNMGQLIAGIGRAAEQGSALMAGRKAGLEPYEAVEKQAGQGIEDVLTRRKASDADLARKANLMKMSDEERMHDPNSQESQALRSMIKRVLPDLKIPSDFTAKQAEQLDLKMGGLLGIKIKMEELKASKEVAIAGKKDKAISDFEDKERKNIRDSKPFRNYQELNSKAEQLRDAANNPSAYGDMASLYNFMKSLDPTSVVRESEFKSVSGVGDLQTKFSNMLQKVQSGKMLQPEQRAEMLRIADLMSGVSKKALSSYAEPTVNKAKKIGADLSNILPYGQEESRSSASSQDEMVRIESHGMVGSIPKSKLEDAKKKDPSLKVL